MDDDIWIGYVKPGPIGQREITYGSLFYTEQYTRKWFDEDIEADKIEVNDNYTLVNVASACGYLIQSPFS